MGCHTWVYRRNYALEDFFKDKSKVREKIKQEVYRDYINAKDHYENPPSWLSSTQERIEPGDDYSEDWFKWTCRYFELLHHYCDKFSDETIKRLYLQVHPCKIIDDKCYSQLDENCDIFRNFEYDEDVTLKSLEETWEYIKKHSFYIYWYDEDDDEIEFDLASSEQRDSLYNKIKYLFEEFNNEIIIEFG